MTCSACNSTNVTRIERWATRCADCHHVELTRRSFVVGIGAALWLLALPKVGEGRACWYGGVQPVAFGGLAGGVPPNVEAALAFARLNFAMGNPQWLAREKAGEHTFHVTTGPVVEQVRDDDSLMRILHRETLQR